MAPLTLGALVLGPVQFERPEWLLLVPVLAGLTAWLGLRSLSGLRGTTRWTAMSVRVFVIALVAAALAEPQLRRESEDVAVTVVLDESRSIPPTMRQAIDAYLSELVPQGRTPDDRLGVVTVASNAYVQSLPRKANRDAVRQFVGDQNATNLSLGVSLAIASTSEDAASRMLLVSDGNETSGSLLQAAEQAKAVGIPIDVLIVDFDHEAETIVDDLKAPATVRAGETINLRVVLTATRPVRGRLLVTEAGEAVDLNGPEEGVGHLVDLPSGKTVVTVPVSARRPGPQSYEAVFEPIAGLDSEGRPDGALGVGDAILENNRASAITFVGSEGWVLLVREDPQESQALERALHEADMRVNVVRAAQFPSTLAQLNAYDSIVLVNEPAYNFSDLQHDLLRQYVHDSGGGLVMAGGPDAFGAGGWIGTAVEDALPIKLDPPQKRQMPRGALVLVVHSVEMPRGVFYGKQVCNAAVDGLSSQDLVGITEYEGWGGQTDWVYPIQPVGNRSAVKRAINSLQFGDMPDFDPSLRLALNGLLAVEAGQKHCIVISDGDPSLSLGVLRQFRSNGITISAVGVYPHSPRDYGTLRNMAQVTGGTFYRVDTAQALATLPQIFMKEAQTIRRSLIWEGDPFQPAVVNVAAEPLRGISAVPPISGYVVAAEREGLSLVTLRGKEGDPVMAQWQHGLGKVVTYTSDVTSRWGAAWVGWEGYRQFWEQHVRWVMRPGGSANIRVNTETRGDETLVVLEAFDGDGERINFGDFAGRAATPDGAGQDLSFRQVGPGRYEAVVDSADPGSYVLSVRYQLPQDEGAPLEGSVQAAVTRPFADEFRALRSNTALLRQVAETTGGRVLPETPGGFELWTREGLQMPVATTSIWHTLAIIAIGVFLLDVGVRRVRLDLAALALAVRRGLRPDDRRAGKQIDSLRAARERVRHRTSAGADVRKRKFEPDPDAADTGEPVALSGEAAPVERKQERARVDDEPADTFSALRAARKRAQEDIEDQQH